MGNKMCKKKVDSVDNANTKNNTPFDRIITRLHLKPNKWKSDPNLQDKQVNRYEVTKKDSRNGSIKHTTTQIRPLSNSKSSDWTEVSLEVPSDKDDPMQFENAKLAIISDNYSENPIPPPRKNKKGIKERLESVAKSSLQAFQKKPVEEPICVKKTINYICPCGDPTHNPHHHHLNQNGKKHADRKSASVSKATAKQLEKEEKRKKNLSVISLPNYNDLKLSVAKNTEDLENRSSTNSASSLPGENGKKVSPKKDYMTRCRSFGSILPNQLLDKLKTPKTPADVESDDSFGALEDWDLRILEHYNPKDSSLPRVRKSIRNEKDMIDEIEGLIVTEEEFKAPPKPPVRRAESLLKKITRTAAERSAQIRKPKEENRPNSATPPPSPVIEDKTPEEPAKSPLPEVDENGRVEHSSLMKILEKYSMEEKLLKGEESIPFIDDSGKSESEESDSTIKQSMVARDEAQPPSIPASLPPSLLEFEKTITNPVEEFLNAERMWILQQQTTHDMIKT